MFVALTHRGGGEAANNRNMLWTCPLGRSPVEASEDPNICARIRDATRTAIEEGISFLKVRSAGFVVV